MASDLKIAYGNSRFAKRWGNKRISFEALTERLRTPIRTAETVEEYAAAPKGERDQIKDVGGFVLGHLKGGERKRGRVEARSGITLDADHASGDFVELLRARIGYSAALYSTHSHTAEHPRYRLIIPLAREISADEYAAVSRLVADEIGMDYFDDTTYEAERLMYWPSCPADGAYVFRLFEGDPLDPDAYLARVSDWRDWALLPTSSRQSALIWRRAEAQADPLTKRGVIGAFCRTYSISAVIARYLAGVYAPTEAENRYDYVPGESRAGVVLYEDKWAYSHHATDPASEQLLNAFDLVRVHRFGDLEERASVAAMTDLALQDEAVKVQILEERRAEAQADFASDFREDRDWTARLERERNGTLKNTLRNLRLILENDTALSGIVYNRLTDELEASQALPWDPPAGERSLPRPWRDADDAQLVSYVDALYGSFSERNFSVAVTKVADDRGYHPIREYLSTLPEWDGIGRAERLLVDYLGAEDTPYTRAVTRKTLCAAVTRVLEPGTKFDYILVLRGPQGIGKSTLAARLGGEWFSDSLTLTDMEDKTGAEKLQGYWLVEISELTGIRKADLDRVKAFVSRQDDKYRASFGRRVSRHPRQCVFIGTTNSEDGFLRDTSGNRRFWVVDTSAESAKKSWELDAETVAQVWAEALALVREGEELYLNAELDETARVRQTEALEADEREGAVEAYLDELLPEGWEETDLYDRQRYFSFRSDPTRPAGVRVRDEVCNLEIWCECFGRRLEDIKPQDSYYISRILKRIGGWERTAERKRFALYGQQRIYRRTGANSPIGRIAAASTQEPGREAD